MANVAVPSLWLTPNAALRDSVDFNSCSSALQFKNWWAHHWKRKSIYLVLNYTDKISLNFFTICIFLSNENKFYWLAQHTKTFHLADRVKRQLASIIIAFPESDWLKICNFGLLCGPKIAILVSSYSCWYTVLIWFRGGREHWLPYYHFCIVYWWKQWFYPSKVLYQIWYRLGVQNV